MNPIEVEWKAKAIWSIWRKADKALRVNSFTTPWSVLPDDSSIKETFRKLARSRRIKAVEAGWRSHKNRSKNAANRSPYRESKLIGTRARGQA